MKGFILEWVVYPFAITAFNLKMLELVAVMML